MPQTATESVEVFGMFSDQERFSLSVALLLFEIVAHGGTAIVPDERGRTEPKLIAALLQTPAHVDIIACFAKEGIESADLQQRPLIEGHVAAWNVFGNAVGQHHM